MRGPTTSSGGRAGCQWFGAAGVLYAIVLVLFLPNAPRATGENGRRERPGIAVSLRELLGLGSFLLLVLYFTLPAMPGWVVKSWMPAVLKDTFKLEEGPAGIS